MPSKQEQAFSKDFFSFFSELAVLILSKMISRLVSILWNQYKEPSKSGLLLNMLHNYLGLKDKLITGTKPKAYLIAWK